jgi:hypothetical protein
VVQEERRKSLEDGQFYTLRQFIEFCGEENGRYWWDRAAPIAEASSSSVVPAAPLQTPPTAAQLRAEQLRIDLTSLKQSELSKRARSLGVSAELIDAAMDADDPKEVFIGHILSFQEAKDSLQAAAPEETAAADMSEEKQPVESTGSAGSTGEARPARQASPVRALDRRSSVQVPTRSGSPPRGEITVDPHAASPSKAEPTADESMPDAAAPAEKSTASAVPSEPEVRHGIVQGTATSRDGERCTIEKHDPDDSDLCWKVKFDDGQSEWFKKDQISEVTMETAA